MYATDQGSMEGEDFSLEQVLVCPDVAENLLSVSKLDDQGLEVLFKSGKVQIGTGGSLKNVLTTGERTNNSYYIEFSVAPHSSQAYNSKSETARDLHLKFNHRNLADIRKLASKSMVDNIPDDIGDFECESCRIGKFRKGSSPQKAKNRASRPAERFHADLCGILEPSKDGYKYILMFTDDYSRYAYMFLLQAKSDAFSKFQELRTDNGGEFKNASFTDYTLAYGILQEFTVPHCSCQNGVAERINLTILNAVRACLHESDLPLPFWDEAALCSMYTRNRSPTAANESM
eukprot:Partr_v1_DN23774_c0_g1_i12_m52758 putative Retrotransposon protein